MKCSVAAGVNMNKNGIFAPRCQMLSGSYCTAMGVKCFEKRIFGGVPDGVCVARSEEVRVTVGRDPGQRVEGYQVMDNNLPYTLYIDSEKRAKVHRRGYCTNEASTRYDEDEAGELTEELSANELNERYGSAAMLGQESGKFGATPEPFVAPAIALSAKGVKDILETLKNPPPPNTALLDAAKRFKEGGLVCPNDVKEGLVPAMLSPGEGFIDGEPIDLPQGVPIKNAAILSNEEFNARMDGFAAEPVFESYSEAELAEKEARLIRSVCVNGLHGATPELEDTSYVPDD